MKNAFSLQRISITSHLDVNLTFRQYKLNLMADFMRMKYEIAKCKQPEIANPLGYSSSTLQRYRKVMNILSPYRNQSQNTKKRTEKASTAKFNNNSHREHHVKRFQMTSNDLKTTETSTKSKNKNKIVLKTGSIHEIN